MKPLQGLVALVTGCARFNGIGRATARALADAGAAVAVSDISEEGTRNDHEQAIGDAHSASWRGLTSLVDELRQSGVEAHAWIGDVSRSDDAERIVSETIAALGGVDILVNNAAAPHGADRNWSWEVPEAAFDEVMRVNTKGVFLMSTVVVRHLLGRQRPGRIVNIASAAGRAGAARRAPYCASKFAVVGLTQAMAKELAGHAITVNAVCPGLVDTDRQHVGEGSLGPGSTAEGPPSPVGRPGTPLDVARAVLFLADPAASYITGECINVNGGALVS
jgi:NAD(P)-dependent dehydrogenase (short-subunit alcohol dehydrogenase family)